VTRSNRDVCFTPEIGHPSPPSRCLLWAKRRHAWLLRFYIHLLLDDDRELERKGRALTRLRLDPNLAAVHLNDALRYGEPQAGAALLAGDRVVGLLELLKQPGLLRSLPRRREHAQYWLHSNDNRP